MDDRLPYRNTAFAAGVREPAPTPSLPASHPHQPTRSVDRLPAASRFDGCDGSATASMVAAAASDGLEPPRGPDKKKGGRDQQELLNHLLPALTTHQCPVCCRLFLSQREAEEHMKAREYVYRVLSRSDLLFHNDRCMNDREFS
ncbi:hypothetical protein MRX96_018440 [Rhipicephalus microplus]